MTDVIYCAQKIRIVVWFEMRLEEFMSIHRHLILIRIKDLHISVFIQCLHTFKQRIWCQFIIMICKRNIITRCNLNRSICIFRNLQWFLMRHYFNPLIRCCKWFKQTGDWWICPIWQTKLPVRICLLFDRLNQLSKIFFLCFIQWDHNGNLWLKIKFFSSLTFQFLRSRKMSDDPLLIWNFPGRCRSDLSCNFSDKSGTSLCFPVTDSFFCIFFDFFPDHHRLLQRNHMHRFCISGIKNNVNNFAF